MVRLADAVGAVVGLAADRRLGEPPSRWHPVVWFGALMAAAERRWWADDVAAGVRHLLLGVSTALVAGGVLRRSAAALVPRTALPAAAGVVGTAAVAVATTLCVAGRALAEAASAVVDALDGNDLVAARHRLQALVGRDVAGLDEPGVVRAVVESVAENTVDAVVAPLCWAAVAGAPGVALHRAVNTLDAMVGYRSDRYRRFGWASARCDDLVNWLPARVTALAVVLARPDRAAAVRRAVRDGARRHPSPNAGLAEAAFAGALGVRLGGTTTYGGVSEERPVLGHGRPPVRADVARAVQLSADVSQVVAGILLGTAVAVARRPWAPTKAVRR